MSTESKTNELEITKDQLIAQVRALTDNQNALIDRINSLNARNEDRFTVPDQIRIIQTFSGNRKETLAWVEDVDQTLEDLEEFEDDPIKWKQIIRFVKSKIINEAREVLIASGNPKEWDDIKEVLLNSFGDKRDITSHIQSLFYIRQGKHTLHEYYHKMKSIDTAIKTSAAQMADYKRSIEAVNKLISLMTLTRYIDGLNGEQLSMYVRSYRPKTLEEAHDISIQHSNATFRQRMEKGPFTSRTPESKNIPTEKPKFSPTNKPSGSGKFKSFQKSSLNDDVSMRTAKSRTEANNHNGDVECSCAKANERESDTGHRSNASDAILDSDDDDFLVDDELNFLVAEEGGTKT